MSYVRSTFFLLALFSVASAPAALTTPTRPCVFPDDTGYNASRFATEVARAYLFRASEMVASNDAYLRKNGSVMMDEGLREFVRASRLLFCHRRGIIDGACFNDVDRFTEAACR